MVCFLWFLCSLFSNCYIFIHIGYKKTKPQKFENRIMWLLVAKISKLQHFLMPYTVAIYFWKMQMFTFASFDGTYFRTYLHLSASFLVLPFTFTKKSDCEITITSKIILMLSVNSIILMLVKLLQMIWGYVTSYTVFVSMFPCLYLWCL